MGERGFVERIQGAGSDADVAILILDHLLEWIHVPGFTPYPEDKLGDTYGIGEEELDEDLMLTILEHFHIRPPTIGELAPFGVVDMPLHVT